MALPLPRRRARLVPFLACMPLLLAAQCGSPYHLEPRVGITRQHDLPLDPATQRLEVLFHDGLVTVEPGDQLAVRLDVELLADDAQRLAELVGLVQPTIEPIGEKALRLRLAPAATTEMESTRTTWRITMPRGRTLQVRTKKGGLVARGADCRLEVEAGLGVLDVRLDGGSAKLATTSGSILLRGAYELAELRSNAGRIDVQLPKPADGAFELDVAGTTGDVYVDLNEEQACDVYYRGVEQTVDAAAEVHVDWQQLVELDGIEYMQGRFAAATAPPATSSTPLGRVLLDVPGRVHLRVQPAAGGR